MNRKDTILIAVLVNSALLVVLFVTAIKNSDKQELPMQNQPVERVVNLPPPALPKVEIKTAQGDEIDQVLKEFAQKVENKTEQQPEAPPQQPAPVDFAKELQALTKAATVQIETPTQKLKADSHYTEVTVKKGDVLERIARNNHTSVAQIMEINHLKSTNLNIGQKLKVPKQKEVVATPAIEEPRVEKRSAPEAPEYYTIKTGDTPWSIAVKHRLKVDELLKMNNLTQEKAKHLKAGDQLRIK